MTDNNKIILRTEYKQCNQTIFTSFMEQLLASKIFSVTKHNAPTDNSHFDRYRISVNSRDAFSIVYDTRAAKMIVDANGNVHSIVSQIFSALTNGTQGVFLHTPPPTPNNTNNTRQPTVVSNNNTRQPTVANSNNNTRQPTAPNSNNNTRQPTVASNNNTRQPTVASNNNTRQPTVANNNNNMRQPTVASNNNNTRQPTAPNSSNTTRHPTVVSNNNTRQPTVANSSNNTRQPTVASSNNTRQPTVANNNNNRNVSNANTSKGAQPKPAQAEHKQPPNNRDSAPANGQQPNRNAQVADNSRKAAADSQHKLFERAHKALSKQLEYAMPYLSEQAVLDLGLVWNQVNSKALLLADYSIMPMSAFRGLEKLIYTLQSARDISVKMIGQAYEKDEQGSYTLKACYRKSTNSIVYNEVMISLYTEYSLYRNFYAHSGNSTDVATRIIDTREEAKLIVSKLLAKIDYNCKKLDEICFLKK